MQHFIERSNLNGTFFSANNARGTLAPRNMCIMHSHASRVQFIISIAIRCVFQSVLYSPISLYHLPKGVNPIQVCILRVLSPALDCLAKMRILHLNKAGNLLICSRRFTIRLFLETNFRSTKRGFMKRIVD